MFTKVSVVITSAYGLSSESKVVLSNEAFTGGCLIRRKAPCPQALGTKKTVAREWANVRKLRLDLEVARASAQSISFTSTRRGRFCTEWRFHRYIWTRKGGS